jgi:RNA polymerase sigma-70 factor (ECF subfamily)
LLTPISLGGVKKAEPGHNDLHSVTFMIPRHETPLASMLEPSADPSDCWSANLRWARNLAGALVRDPHAADDLTQDVWTSALQRPPSDTVPWQAAIATRLRNAAVSFHRARSRRQQRERLAARTENVEDMTIETDERLALVRHVVDLVDALPEPYRSVIRLRYLDDMMPQEIAQRTGCNVDTVKVRLKRGLERLRATLDRESGGRRETWVVMLAPLARIDHAGTPVPGGSFARMGLALFATCAAICIALLYWRTIAGAQSADIATAQVPASRHRAHVDDLSTSTDVGSRLAGARQRVAASQTCTVIAVLAGSHAPVAGARIEWWPLPWSDDAEAQIEEWFRDGTLELHTRAGASTTTANADGRSELAGASRGFLVTASTGNLWGKRIISGSEAGPVPVELCPDGDVTVRVLDMHRRPLKGARVQLCANTVCNGDPSTREYIRADTDPNDGLAVLHHVGHVLNSTDSDCKARAEILVFGMCAFDTFTLDRAELPSEPQDLVAVEALAECAFNLSEADGASNDTRVSLSENRFGGGGTRDWAQETSGPMPRMFPIRIGWGGTFLASADSSALGYRGAEVKWPENEDDRVIVDLRPAEQVHMHGRILSEPGVPIANAAIAIGQRVFTTDMSSDRVVQHDFSFSGIRTRTDDSGRFICSVSKRLLNAWIPTLTIWREDASAEPDTVAHLALAAIQEDVDLADVRLSPMPIILSGRIVSDSLVPVPKAQLFWQSFESHDDTVPSESWEAASVRTDGQFTIRAEEMPRREFLVCARLPGRATRTLTVTPGQTDVQIVLPSTGSISGRVRTHPSMRSDVLCAIALPEGTDVRSDDDFAWIQASKMGGAFAVVSTDGTFMIPGLAPGLYKVALKTADSNWSHALRVVHDVRVDTNEVRRDERLNPLDLRAEFKYVIVHVEDEEGRPVANANIDLGFTPLDCQQYLDELDRNTHSDRCDSDGTCRLLLSDHITSLKISADDFVSRIVSNTMEDMSVILPRCPELTLRLSSHMPDVVKDFDLMLLAYRDSSHGGESASVVMLNENLIPAEGLRCSSPLTGDVEFHWAVGSIRDSQDALHPGAPLWSVLPSHQVRHVSEHCPTSLTLDPPSTADIADAIQRICDRFSAAGPQAPK